MSTQFLVQPQQHNKGWHACEPHLAQRWAVLRIEHFTSRGRKMSATRCVLARATRAEAQAVADALTSSRAKAKRKLPSLNARFPHDGETPIIARGLGRNFARGL